MFDELIRSYPVALTFFLVIMCVGVGSGAGAYLARRRAQKLRRIYAALLALPKDADNADLLACYSDLLEIDGPEGPYARAFLRIHRTNEPLMRVCGAARSLRKAYRRGDLKPGA